MGLLQSWRARRGRRLASTLPLWPPVEPRRDGHVVQFYSGDFPAESVARFVQEGLSGGEIAILVATAEHVKLIDGLLGDQKGRVLYLDADEVLAKFMHEGRPDRLRFLDTVGDLVAQAAQAGNGGVRAFGEMVVLLCQRGQPEAAHQLEELWNELGDRHGLKLLCSYPMASLSGTNRAFEARLRDSHSHTVAA